MIGGKGTVGDPVITDHPNIGSTPIVMLTQIEHRTGGFAGGTSVVMTCGTTTQVAMGQTGRWPLAIDDLGPRRDHSPS